MQVKQDIAALKLYEEVVRTLKEQNIDSDKKIHKLQIELESIRNRRRGGGQGGRGGGGRGRSTATNIADVEASVRLDKRFTNYKK